MQLGGVRLRRRRRQSTTMRSGFRRQRMRDRWFEWGLGRASGGVRRTCGDPIGNNATALIIGGRRRGRRFLVVSPVLAPCAVGFCPRLCPGAGVDVPGSGRPIWADLHPTTCALPPPTELEGGLAAIREHRARWHTIELDHVPTGPGVREVLENARSTPTLGLVGDPWTARRSSGPPMARPTRNQS